MRFKSKQIKVIACRAAAHKSISRIGLGTRVLLNKKKKQEPKKQTRFYL